MKENKQKQREFLLKFKIFIVFIFEILSVGFYYDWSKNMLILNICFAIPISVGVFIIMPRKCVNCNIFMSRKLSIHKKIIYICKNCGNFIDTEIGLADSANS